MFKNTALTKKSCRYLAIFIALLTLSPITLAESNPSPLERDCKKHLQQLEQKIQQNDPHVQLVLGLCYLKGYGLPPQDYGKKWYDAHELIQKSADQGYAVAQNILGELYADGQGFPQDYAKALEWFSKAAEQGNRDAQYNLGLMYYQGGGTPKNDQKALEWLQKASKGGNVQAQALLKKISH
jgi:TPR repeat protein